MFVAPPALLLLALTRPAHACDELGGAARATTLEPPPGSSPAAPVAPVAAPAPAVSRPAPAPVARTEHARYRIDYGVLAIGKLEIAIARALPGATVAHAGGHGSGGLLGLGRVDERLSTELDLTRLDSRRWASAREDGDGVVRDRAEQAQVGRVSLVREHVAPAGAREVTRATLAAPVLDPLGFLLRLRVAPPGAGAGAQSLYVLDGQALWRVTITSADRVPASDGREPIASLRLHAEAEPIRYDGAPDPNGRKHRSFTLWLSDDAARVPLRLEMPLGIADLVVALTDISRG